MNEFSIAAFCLTFGFCMGIAATVVYYQWKFGPILYFAEHPMENDFK